MDRDRFKRAQPPIPEPNEDEHTKAWTAWLSDDPLPPVAQTQVRQVSAPRSTNSYLPRGAAVTRVPPAVPIAAVAPQPPAAVVPAANVTINIHMPKLKLPSSQQLKTTAKITGQYGTKATNRLKSTSKTLKLPRKRILVTVAAVGAVLLVSVLAKQQFAGKPGLTAATGGAKGSSVSVAGSAVAAARATPSFAPVIPKTKPELATVTTGISGYDGTRDSYTFSDTLNGVSLTVSEQPISSDQSQSKLVLLSAASKLGAKESIAYNDGTALMKTDEKTGSQVIVLSKNNLLIFVQSGFPHPVSDWSAYLNTLQ